VAWPGWLSAPLVLLMIAISSYEVVRLSLASATRRPTERDADGFHLAMGVTMAAMLTGRLSPFTDSAAAVLFGAATVWFAARVPSAIAVHTAASPSLACRVSHVVSSAAMVFMLVAMRPVGPGAGMAAMDPASAHGPAILAVAGVLAVLMAAGALAHIGSRPGGPGGPAARVTHAGASGSDGEGTALATATEAAMGLSTAAEVAMGLAMAAMLVAML